MNRTTHRIYIGSMVTITILVTIYLAFTGYAYYQTPLEERFYFPNHDWFKPSGAYGHGLGIIGTLMILFGVAIYILRKRYNFLGRFITLKYLLEFHIFLCTLGPILILFHTAFKFGGIVSIAFWSMVAVVLSGVIGRFIYIQIPRTINGRELSLQEIQKMKGDLSTHLIDHKGLDQESIALITIASEERMLKKEKNSFLTQYFYDKQMIRVLQTQLKARKLRRNERKRILSIVSNEISLSNKISRLNKMQQLFKYWHVAHLPFALIMLVVVLLHVGITLAFGYKWIF